MTYNDMCDNGCPRPRHAPRKICSECIKANDRSRKSLKREDGNVIQARNAEKPLEGFNPLMARMARVSLRVGS